MSAGICGLVQGTDPEMLYRKPVIGVGGPYEMIIIDICFICKSLLKFN